MGDLKSKVDRVWDAFWSGGISNPLEVIEQITYLLFIRCLDEIQTLKDDQAQRTGKPDPAPLFPEDQQDLRWHNFKAKQPEKVPRGSPHAHHVVIHGCHPGCRFTTE
ncbi:type I restriction-modification system subunit M N-terminal domain-containing protein [Streptomyces bauhiniae]